MTKAIKHIIVARILPDGPTVAVNGREAYTLRRLIDAGKRGVSSIEHVGPRLSAYVHDLRGFGFIIETEYEKHDGPYPGSHARYRMHSDVEIISDTLAQPVAPASVIPAPRGLLSGV